MLLDRDPSQTSNRFLPSLVIKGDQEKREPVIKHHRKIDHAMKNVEKALVTWRLVSRHGASYVTSISVR